MMVRKTLKSVRKTVRHIVDPTSCAIQSNKETMKTFLKVKNFSDLAESSISSSSEETDNYEERPNFKRKAANEEIFENLSEPKKIKDEDIKIEVDEEEICSQIKNTAVKLSSIHVLGEDIFYRQAGPDLLFQTKSVIEMLSRNLPLDETNPLQSVVGGSQAYKSKAFISWPALRAILEGGLLDLATRGQLLSRSYAGESGSDLVEICNNTIPFKVKNGVVYLEILAALATVGKAEEALEGKWATIDETLKKNGLPLKSAFKRKGGAKGLQESVARSYITLEAYGIVAEKAEFKEKTRELLQAVGEVSARRERVQVELEQTVEMILRTGRILPETGEEGSGKWGDQVGSPVQVYCENSLCGRGYHFVTRCCAKTHSLTIAGQQLGYVRKDGRVFLEKCAAFAALGRLYVIRCSDYRRTDELLEQAGGIEQHFLYEQDDVGLGRNRRTHLSLDGFILLVQAGFADPCKEEAVRAGLAGVREQHQTLRRDSCEQAEVIDLSSCTSRQRQSNTTEESSSGMESDDFSATQTQGCPFNDLENESDDDLEQETTATQIGDCIELLGNSVKILTVANKMFMEKSAIIKLLQSPVVLSKYNTKLVERILEVNNICMDEAFYMQGRHKVFISTAALKAILNCDSLQDFNDKDQLLEELRNLEEDLEREKCQVLQLNGNLSIQYKMVAGTLYFDSQKLLSLTSPLLSPHVHHNPAKANQMMCKILSERGVNTDHCFYRNVKSKYAFISLSAISTLLRSDVGPLSERPKTRMFVKDLFAALKKNDLVRDSCSDPERSVNIRVDEEVYPLKYKIEGGILFLHRKSCFECIGLESTILSSKKGYSSINGTLRLAGLALETCYIASKQQRYSYISVMALIQLLLSRDPLIVCLGKKDRFLRGLLSALEAGLPAGLASLKLESGTVVQVQHQPDGPLLLPHPATLQLAKLPAGQTLLAVEVGEGASELLIERGLEPSTALLAGPEPGRWVSLPALLVLLTAPRLTDPEPEVAWRDLLSALARQEPRLRQQIITKDFISELVAALVRLFVEQTEGKTEQVHDYLELSEDWVARPAASPEQEVPHSGAPSPLSPTSPASPTSLDGWPGVELSPARLDTIQRDLEDCGGNIGDWEVEQLGPGLVRLAVRPGYGASRKGSFLQPDYAAVLRYCLVIRADAVSLVINEHKIPDCVVEKILARTEQEGTLSFLFQLISLRPCFGSFAPELVETVSQSLEKKDLSANLIDVYIDKNFVGTSSSGRTYAGTVRHKQCELIASEKVSDTCQHCRKLDKLTINRSVLGQAEQGEGRVGHKSVWQLATTSQEGCRFLCPQVQSFNTSLPHAFDGSSQASAIVQHVVKIGSELRVEVELSGLAVSRTFPEFQQSRALGPLLDWVAGLRLCTGYPNLKLVSQAAFIRRHASRLPPDLKKMFLFLTVDEEFRYEMSEVVGEQSGTIRSPTCQGAAEPGSDICKHCRSLQEPMEFLSSQHSV